MSENFLKNHQNSSFLPSGIFQMLQAEAELQGAYACLKEGELMEVRNQ